MTGEEVTVTVASVSYGDSGTLVETLPAGLAHVSGSGGTASGQTVTFNLTAADQTVTYMATASDTAGTYSISGVLTASDGMTSDVGGATDVTVTEPPPPVTGPNATRSFSSSTVAAGGMLNVTITAANYGDTGLVTETLPEGFTYVSSDSGRHWRRKLVKRMSPSSSCLAIPVHVHRLRLRHGRNLFLHRNSGGHRQNRS